MRYIFTCFLLLCYNIGMKKFLTITLIYLILANILPAYSSEIEEDYLDIASNYCITGDYNTALEYLNKILTLNPDNKYVQDLKKGLTHIISKDNKSFVESLNPLVKQSQEFKYKGDEKKELDLLTQAAQGQNSYLAYYFLGNYYADKQNYLKAADSYNSSVSSRADFAPAYLSTAIVLYNSGKYQSVINPIDKYLIFCPADDLAYAIKSRAEFELGLLEDSKKDNDKAIELNDCPEYQFDRAKILYKYDKFEESKKIFSSLLKYIQTSKIYEYMGMCDYAMQNYTSALSNIDKAIILSNDDQYLESLYNEIKEIIKNKKNEEIQDEEQS